MPRSVTATELRSNVYRILDRVLESGEAQEVNRSGSKLLIIPMGRPRRRLGDRPQRDGLNCTLEELVATSWEKSWEPDP
jgi:hypothetical protein